MSGSLRAVWAVAAVAVAGAAFAAIVTVLSGEPGEREFKTVYSLVAVLLCGGAAVGALHLLDRPGLRLFGAVVLVAAAVDFLLFELGIWNGVLFDGDSSNWLKLIPIGLAWGIALLVLGTLPLVPGSRGLLLIAVPFVGACALVGATIATVMAWREIDSTGWAKTLAVLAILMLAGFLLTPLAERFDRAQASP